ncbi:cysteine-rich receptor-like protein kinase 15 isoform X1 [Iris pallida]|uniref:Cysteine-rich receptor-like protein kinase 15 isoform X1 n=1 Tax=Iris pallida TaxID=29817 RepID=A0AAX6HTA0_IRIPA|nr:cysteine-rich receptor-like protein kinase 15 isoform X1 [Iris pallida]KAJ6848854.1 cysteine-rich receptor-like protein kinase 15 isoform X1 [Iris pallida]
MARFYFLLLLALLLLLQSAPTATAEDSLYRLCEGNNYTGNSSFQSNLKSLLVSLSSSNSSYFTDSMGDSDMAYGLVMCRGDVDSKDCKDCIKAASNNITQLCPQSMKAIVWYDYCQLRYSDSLFFTSFSKSLFFNSSDKGVLMFNLGSQQDTGKFNATVKVFMGEVADDAAFNSSPSMFATGMIKYKINLPAIYGLAQCTRELTPDTCSRCLQRIITNYWDAGYGGSRGGRFLDYSCNFRYEAYTFFTGDPTISLDTTIAPTAETEGESGKGKKKNIGKVLSIVIPSVVGLALVITLFICLLRRRSLKATVLGRGIADLEDITRGESLLFNFSVLKAATDDFSDSNKLGQGGFGAVYKGTLPDGEEIAVKRLSANSNQGIEELKNELLLVAKLQHKNLVRLRGVCLEQEEKLVVYQYVPNRSLDTFLFDPVKRVQLDWGRRFNIIGGIARGLRYLHEESHLKVIHRDLKASNVLLDSDMNPKIADFGLARLFAVDETQCTGRVVGTFGYMAPEYAMHGLFSVKLDVFSFGVLLLEIVTGKKNNPNDLLSYTWKHWREGTALEIVDPSLGENFSRDEVLRCIQIGLLCIQDVPADRPSMSSIVQILYSPSVSIQAPLQSTLAGSGTSTSDSSVSTRRFILGSGVRSQVCQVANSDDVVSISPADPMLSII